MTDIVSPKRPAARLIPLAIVAAGAISACAAPGTEPEATTPAEAPAASAPSAAAAADQTRITMAECPTPSEGLVHFKVGDAELAVPADAVRDAIPAGMQPPLQQEVVARELQSRVAQGAGCPQNPIDATLLMLNADLGHPLLNGDIGLLRSPDGRITEQFADLTRDLQRQPTSNCRELSGDLMACVGTETVGDRQTPVMYVITTDPNETLNTGGPLAVRCVLQEESVRGCNIVDRLPGNLTVDASLNPGTYTTEGLAAAHDAVLRRVETYRR